MDIPILIALIVLNGVFAMSEIALVTARKARLQKLIDEGDTAAATALALGQDPTRFLSAIQIGITSIGVLNGVFGEAALAKPLAQWLAGLGMNASYAGTVSTAIVVVLITYFSIVVGELVPKRIGQSNPERIARMVARPIDLLARLTTPFVALLSISTQRFLKLLGMGNAPAEATITEDEIHAVLAEGTTSGAIEQSEHTMVRNLFRLDDRQISSLMVPRSDVISLDVNDSFEQCMAQVQEYEHSLFPVVNGSFDDLLGVINVRQWLLHALHDPGQRELRDLHAAAVRASQREKAVRAVQDMHSKEQGAGSIAEMLASSTETPTQLTGEQDASGAGSSGMAALLETPIYIPETITGMELLEHFKQSGARMAFVIDEYGEVQGIVTVRDLLEAITGEFVTEDPSDAWAVQREDGSWLLDGHIPIMELKDRLGLKTVPEEEKGRYQTLSGMVMLLTGRLPAVTDCVLWEDWRFEVVDMDGKVIDKVQATRQAAPPIETLGQD